MTRWKQQKRNAKKFPSPHQDSIHQPQKRTAEGDTATEEEFQRIALEVEQDEPPPEETAEEQNEGCR